MNAVTWTPDRIERLTTLWKANQMSAAEIGAEMGISRSAVIGKANRLGLTDRRRPPTFGRPPRERASRPRVTRGDDPRRITRVASALAMVSERVDVAFTAPPECKPIPLVELTDEKCHWPIGAVGDDDFGFCGHSSLRGLPYCAAHTRVAHRPAANDAKVGIVERGNFR
ncbi:GcrA family cell cycle regulator [Bradyrhizobium quebecense]|uniref:GcrA cell cycle regulator n=1 Tax=Bradyrhizobium quebecense TaxID=2748629 RepID=A0A973WQL3_9BRAD|nr:GcrA family cell cycle regulator [Bradyrhizobium quebecense]UGA45988.1 GcrA family cell cycle regulator [Bradyrhizobium quebecense]